MPSECPRALEKGSEGEGGEGGDDEPGVRDGDILPDGETAEDNVSATAAGENRLALAAAAAAAPAAAGP